MKKNILSIIFLLAAIGGFFGYVNDKYQDTKKLKTEEVRYNKALNNSKDLLEIRDNLLSKYNTFDVLDLERLEKLLPDNVDNINLILEIDEIASRNLLMVDNISINSSEDKEGNNGSKNKIASSENLKYNYIDLSFSTTANYERLVNFVKDLSKSLRVIDIRSISFNSKAGESYKVDFTIRTYWTKK